MLEQCSTFRKTFDEKHKAKEILFQEGGIVRTNEFPFPKHHRDKGKVMY